jgi:hypothetical protein
MTHSVPILEAARGAAQLLGGAGGCSRPIQRHQAIGMSALGQKQTSDLYKMPFQPNPAHPFVATGLSGSLVTPKLFKLCGV